MSSAKLPWLDDGMPSGKTSSVGLKTAMLGLESTPALGNVDDENDE